jgi:hypothetical protein
MINEISEIGGILDPFLCYGSWSVSSRWGRVFEGFLKSETAVYSYFSMLMVTVKCKMNWRRLRV